MCVYIDCSIRKEAKQLNWGAILILNKQNELNILIERYTENAMYLPNPGSCRRHCSNSSANFYLKSMARKEQLQEPGTQDNDD